MHELQPKDHPDYRCRRDGWFHDYSNCIIENSEVLVEQCIRCGHRIQFNKDDKGDVDGKRYGETHELWFLQPNHPFFKKYYPDFKVPPPKNDFVKKTFEERKAIIAEELNQFAKESRRSTFTGTGLTNRD